MRVVVSAAVIALVLGLQTHGPIAHAPAQTGDVPVVQALAVPTPEYPVGSEPVGECVVTIGGAPVRADTHAIVVPDQPTPQELYAAAELRGHLQLITGQELSVVAEGQLGSRIPLAIGNTRLLAALAPPVDLAGLGTEGIHLRTDGPALLLAGNRRGVLYAVFVFLEDYLGCRWFAIDCATWPTAGAIEVPAIDRRYVPPFSYRCTDYPNARPASFSLRNRLNGRDQRLTEEQGGQVRYRGFVHTFDQLVPAARYFAAHPEYYSQIGGQRVDPGRTQLCLSNPDVLRIATETVRAWLQADPDVDIVSVSQNDNSNYCRCPDCDRLAQQEGSQSGPLLQFVNAIAANIAADYPSVLIDTLAYTYTRKPPRTLRPRENVVIRLCNFESCSLHPLATDPVNGSFVQDLTDWGRIAPRLQIWDYTANFSHSISPHPNLQVLQPNAEYYLRKGVSGVYQQGTYYTWGAEMAELRSYLIAKSLWDPQYDAEQGTREFCAAYYGPAGDHVQRYLELIRDRALSTPGFHLYLRNPPTSAFLSRELLAEASELFDQAEAAVGENELLRQRVQTARLPVMYAQLMRPLDLAYAEQHGRLMRVDSPDVQTLALRFSEIARAAKVTRVSEAGLTPELDSWLQSLALPPAEIPIVRLQSSTLTASVLPALGGRLWRLQLGSGGRDLLRVIRADDRFRPMRLGCFEVIQTRGATLGRYDVFRVTEQSATSVTMEAEIGQGLTVTRTIALDARRPLARVSSTVLKQAGAAASVTWSANCGFAVSSVGSSEVRVRQADRSWRTVPMPDAPATTRERRSQLTGAGLPAGTFALVDRSADLALMYSSRRAALARAEIVWNEDEARVNLLGDSRPLTLEVGQSLTVEQSLQVYQPASQLPDR